MAAADGRQPKRRALSQLSPIGNRKREFREMKCAPRESERSVFLPFSRRRGKSFSHFSLRRRLHSRFSCSRESRSPSICIEWHLYRRVTRTSSRTKRALLTLFRSLKMKSNAPRSAANCIRCIVGCTLSRPSPHRPLSARFRALFCLFSLLSSRSTSHAI